MTVNGTFLDPAGVTPPEDIVVQSSIETGVSGVIIYDGFLKRRYRFHYELLMDDYVYKENISDFNLAIQEIWTKNKPGELILLKNVSLYE